VAIKDSIYDKARAPPKRMHARTHAHSTARKTGSWPLRRPYMDDRRAGPAPPSPPRPLSPPPRPEAICPAAPSSRLALSLRGGLLRGLGCTCEQLGSVGAVGGLWVG
jgi:hypothetical protein